MVADIAARFRYPRYELLAANPPELARAREDNRFRLWLDNAVRDHKVAGYAIVTLSHFRGELRATGQILRDQSLFLQRAGFDAFELTKDADAAAFVAAVHRYSVFYQPAADGRASTLTARLARVPQH